MGQHLRVHICFRGDGRYRFRPYGALHRFFCRSCRVTRGCDLLILLCVHIHCCGNGGLWFRSYSGSLLKSAKVTKTLLPHHSAPRLGSVCPHSGITPRVAAMGHPWPSAAKPASLPVSPLRNACVRPAWLTGRLRSRACRGGLRADQGVKPARCAWLERGTLGFGGGCCQALMVGECYVNCLQRNSSWTDCKFNDKLFGR